MFKINIADKSGKTFKLELETEEFIGKSLHDKVQGKELLPDLDGYEFEISGASDKSGFTAMKDVPGIGLKRVLLTYGKAMKKRPRREGKKKRSNPTPKGLRLRKTVRGQIISSEITQINLKIIKEGTKKLAEVFPDQNKAKETRPSDAELKEEPKPEETPQPAPEAVPEQKPEEKVEEQPTETNITKDKETDNKSQKDDKSDEGLKTENQSETSGEAKEETPKEEVKIEEKKE